MMKELLKNMLFMGAGAVFLTKEKLEELKNELVDKGKLTQDEGKELVDEWMKKSETLKDQFELKLNQMVADQIKKMNLATAEDIQELRRKIEELQVAINARAEE
ncbi:phasin family protein [Desulfolithobacter sp.]